jgi:LysR family hydrogen peroxide-inducible transcriptional activator
VIATAAGEALIAHARRVLGEADDLVESARRLGDPFGGTIRIGVIPTVSPYLLPEIAPALRAKFPRLTVLWVEQRTEPLLADLRAGKIDAGLLAAVSGMDDLEREKLIDDPFVLAGPPSHPLMKSGRKAVADELAETPVLLLEEGHCFRDQALALCNTRGARAAEFQATSLSTLAQMVAGGVGVTLLPSIAVPVENRRGVLAIRGFAPPVPSRTLVLVWRKRSPRAGTLRAVAREIATASGDARK